MNQTKTIRSLQTDCIHSEEKINIKQITLTNLCTTRRFIIFLVLRYFVLVSFSLNNKSTIPNIHALRCKPKYWGGVLYLGIRFFGYFVFVLILFDMRICLVSLPRWWWWFGFRVFVVFFWSISARLCWFHTQQNNTEQWTTKSNWMRKKNTRRTWKENEEKVRNKMYVLRTYSIGFQNELWKEQHTHDTYTWVISNNNKADS